MKMYILMKLKPKVEITRLNMVARKRLVADKSSTRTRKKKKFLTPEHILDIYEVIKKIFSIQS